MSARLPSRNKKCYGYKGAQIGQASTTIINPPNDIHSSSIPNFILNGYRIDIFLLCIKDRLSSYKELYLNDKFTHEFKNTLNSLKFCYNSVIQLYRTMSSILLNCDSITPEDISKIENGLSYIDNNLLVLRAKQFFSTTEVDQTILVESQFINNINEIKSSLIAFYESLDRCSYTIFTNFIMRSNSLTIYLKNNLTTERDVKIPGYKFLELIYFKNWVYKNIFEAFEDILDVSKLNYSVGFDRSQLMPGVFYEYFLFHDVEIGSNIFFHDRKKYSYHDDNMMDCFEMKNLDNTTDIYKYQRSVDNDDQTINYYFVCNKKPIEFFPNFEFQSKTNNNLPFYIYNFPNVEDTKNQRKCAVFHPKTLGNISTGFWVSFADSGKKYYCKELNCVSEKFTYTYSSNDFADCNLTIRRSSDETAESESYTDDSSLHHYLYSRYRYRDPCSRRFHFNEYVELSGYLLLEFFVMIPKVDSFFSYFYGKPMIMVEGIDESEFVLLSQFINDEKSHYNFNNIYNDRYAVFMSSIQLQKLRCMQLIFKIADFHPGNLAASVTKKQLQNNFFIEYIEKIQAIDIWPAARIADYNYLFNHDDSSSCIETCPFDYVIFNRLDHNNNKNEIYFQNKDGHIIPQDLIQSQEYNSIRREFEERNEIIDSISEENLTKLYGERIIGIHDKPHHYRIIITFYAINDMFCDALMKNPHLFDELNELDENICEHMIIIMLKRNYSKITKDLDVLPEIPNFDIDSINLGNLDSFENKSKYIDFFKYIRSAVEMMYSVILRLEEKICDWKRNPLKIITPEVYQLSIVGVEGKLDYKITKVKDIWSILFEGQRYLGIAFSTDNEDLRKNLRHFDFKLDANEQMSILKRNIGHDIKFYLICSPLVYDLAKRLINHIYKLSEFKNIYEL